MKNQYYSLSLRVSWLSIWTNFVLAVVQFIIGLQTASISVLIDAVDSLRDIIATVVVVFSLRLSSKPADTTHPFGHGRVEDVGGLIISLFLLAIGLSFLKDSFLRLIYPKPVTVTFVIFIVMLSISAIKLFLGFITQRVSRQISSDILKADAAHHYTDFISTLIVAFGVLFVRKGYVYIDSLLGLLISFFIIFWSAKMGREFIDNLIGKRASPELYEKIKSIVFSFRFVEGVHEIEIHTYGKNRIISLHIEMNPALTLEEVHGVADGIEKKIYNENLGRCVVHVDLKKGAKIIEKKRVEKLIKNILATAKDIKDFHGMEIITSEEKTVLNFHLLLDKNASIEESHLIYHRLSNLLKEKFGFSQVNIHIEPYKEVKNDGD